MAGADPRLRVMASAWLSDTFEGSKGSALCHRPEYARASGERRGHGLARLSPSALGRRLLLAGQQGPAFPS